VLRRDDLDGNVRWLQNVVSNVTFGVDGNALPPQHRDVRDDGGSCEGSAQLRQYPGQLTVLRAVFEQTGKDYLEPAVPEFRRHFWGDGSGEEFQGRLLLRKPEELVEGESRRGRRHAGS